MLIIVGAAGGMLFNRGYKAGNQACPLWDEDNAYYPSQANQSEDDTYDCPFADDAEGANYGMMGRYGNSEACPFEDSGAYRMPRGGMMGRYYSDDDCQMY